MAESDRLFGQEEAIRAPLGPCLILAGPGTGKTHVLIKRISYLINGGALPSSLLLLTFTNKAASEMVRRLEANDPLTKGLKAGTFHRLALLFLRDQGKAGGLISSFTILDRDASADLIAREARALGLNGPSLATSFEAKLSFAINRMEPLDHVLDPALKEALGGQGDLLARRYAESKARARALDFDDLLLWWHGLLAEGFPSGANNILVDEYQDVTPLQAEIVHLLAKNSGNVTVVGDEGQSIYGFRGTSPQALGAFKMRWPRCRIRELTLNYRSTPQIVSLSNHLLPQVSSLGLSPLRAQRPSGPPPVLADLADRDEQALFVARHARRLVKEGALPCQIAVLSRLWAPLDPVHRALQAQGLPVQWARPDHREALQDLPPWPDSNAVTLSTIHGAKGLEWDNVFIIDMVEGILPSAREMAQGKGVGEELRLFYVAVTRARQRLFLCVPRMGRTTPLQPSRFISGLPENLSEMERWQVR